jgi:hypothetical protein
MRKNMLYVIDLDRPLKEMADNRDFSLLLSVLSPSCLDCSGHQGGPAKHLNNGRLQSMLVAPNESSAYVGHAAVSIFSFDPTNPAAGDASARWVIATGDAHRRGRVGAAPHLLPP